ncbi:MAG: meso-butanediol dehydrogenase/(S,S)-butanediol dehydrogenase/diacetyl reductase [Parasphingorhabdus sp.]|jgi:meso-butanediol dehydrogenase/(S,S)-butanediol dehydrogenase/diacetyl reductase
MGFSNKTVLVTGGTRGIGAACVEAFLDAGARVAVNGRTEESVAAAILKYSAELIAAPGDVSTVMGCKAALELAIEGLGGLDVLVNNAGIFHKDSIEEMDEYHWDAVMNANVKSVQFCTKFAIPSLRKSAGNIINIASESGINGYPNTSAYCASKGAVVNLTRSMAMELAPTIRVNAICPGVVETDMTRTGFAIDGDEDEGIRQQNNAYPLGRIGTTAQIAAAVLYLASSDADFISGIALPIEGGATVGKW